MRFTIRDVLWLMVVAGVACGWWMEHARFKAVTELLKGKDAELRIEQSRPATVWVGDKNKNVRRGTKMLITVEEDGRVGFQPQ